MEELVGYEIPVKFLEVDEVGNADPCSCPLILLCGPGQC